MALANIDDVIALIKASPSSVEAKAGAHGPRLDCRRRAADAGARRSHLHAAAERQRGVRHWSSGGGYKLTETQAQAILDMRLHRLTGLEQDKIVAEYQELLAQIVDLTDILARPERLTQVVREELIAVREQFGDARRTEINRDHLDLSTEDLIEPQDVVVTLSHAGYAKSQPVTEYQAQRRGGRGKAATAVKDEDFVEKLFVAHTHDTILCFCNRGKVYWKRVFELPQAGRGSRGKPMVNLLPLEEGEKINAMLPIKQFDDDHFVFMATSQGTVKKTPLSAFSRPRASGIIAVDLRYRRSPGGRGAHRRHARNHAVLQRRQVHPLQRRGSASDGARCHRRARHQARRRPGADLADRGGRRPRPHGLGQRLRQAHAARGLPGRMAAAGRASSRCRPPSAMAKWSPRCK